MTPLIHGSDLVAALDIDSPIPERFDRKHEKGLQKFVDTIGKLINWEDLRRAFEKEAPAPPSLSYALSTTGIHEHTGNYQKGSQNLHKGYIFVQ